MERASSIVDLIRAQAGRTPEAVAVDADGRSLSYGELESRTNQLARRLMSRGVGPEVVVGLCAEPSLALIVSMLGIWKAGGACLPLDPRHPDQRRAFCERDASVRFTLSQLDETELAHESDAAVDAGLSTHGLAYLIYTSGSTGRPKGVAVEHGGLSNLACAQRQVLGLGEGDRVLQFASPAFDAAIAEVTMALGAGATLCLGPRDSFVGPALFDTLRRRRVTCVTLPPSLLLASGRAELPDLRHLFVAGEACPARVVDQWAPGRSFRNLYGPTEATVWTTSAKCEAGRPPNLGLPIPGVEVRVLDEVLRPVADGAPGELCIGGAGVARGYLGDSELTRARFVPDPSGTGRLFRSGDRGRRLPDGSLEFLGRADEQVKVRGVRVELGEVEATLANHPDVNELAVALAGEELVAYVASPAPTEELRAHLARWLPDAMRPSRWVRLAALPRSASGKIDRRALPAPAPGGPSPERYVAPRDEVETWLLRTCAELLANPQIGIDDDLFALGAHSLTCARLLARLRSERDVDLPLATIFESPTVAALARALERAPHAQLDGELSAAARAAAPASFAEERICLVEALEPGLAVYNAPLLIRARGGDLAALQRALDEIVRRHEPLRTTFVHASGEIRPVVAEPRALEAPVIDLSQLPASARAEALVRWAREEAGRPFDLAGGPLLRAIFVKLGADELALILVLHHTLTDGWSTGVLVHELEVLSGSSRLPELPLTVREAAARERARLEGPAGASGIKWWHGKLAGTPPLALALARPAPAHRRRPGARQRIRIAPTVARTLAELGRAEHATTFMVLLAGFEALLARYSGQTDFAVGSPTANRPRAELEPLIGCFVNTLVLRADLSGEPTFRELIRRVRGTALDAYAHVDVPFQHVVEALRPDRATPPFRVLFAFENVPEPPRGGRITAEEIHSGTAMFDLTLSLREATDPDALAGYLEYDTELFDADTARRVAGHFESLLAQAASRPDEQVGRHELLAADERRQIVVEWNETARPCPAGAVHEWFSAQAARTPDAPAVRAGGVSLGYGELERRTDELARTLLPLGCRGRPVAILVERSVELAVAVLGALKAGGACLPLDPEHPPERLRFMLDEMRPEVVLTQTPLAARLPHGTAKIICLDASATATGAHDGPLPRVSPDDLAYVLYTSGSTGRPKGVLMPHRALANLVAWQAAERVARRTLMLAPLTFDVSFQELFTTWCAGGLVVVADSAARYDPSRLAQLIAGERIERLFSPAAIVQRLAAELADDPRPLASLSEVFASGEALRITSEVARLFQALPNCVLENHYGPTETHVVTSYRLAGARADWPAHPPIGRPIANTRLYLLAAGAPVPVGATGEIHVAGAALARGYAGSGALTADRFIPDPFGAPGERLYRTGDLGRFRADGVIEFLGRADRQVKIRGFRVEPGEVEAVLASHPRVRAAAVVPASGGARAAEGEPASGLIAYVVAASPCDGAELRAHLERFLPNPMLPSAFVFLEALPLTKNGKLDREALPAPSSGASPIGYVAPRSEAERRIAEIWTQLLRVPRVGVEDDFFAIGGHSLLAMQVATRVSRAFGVKVFPRVLFECPTVALLAQHIQERLLDEIERPERLD